MKTYATLLIEVQDRVNRQRAIERVIARPDFVEAYERACQSCRSHVETLIVGCDREGVVRWIREQVSREYGELSLRELRRIGQKLGVPRYNNLSKDLLLSEIVNRAEEKARGSENGPDPEHHQTPPGDA